MVYFRYAERESAELSLEALMSAIFKLNFRELNNILAKN